MPVCLLAIALCSFQGPEPNAYPEDSLHAFTELELGPDMVELEHFVDVEGSCSVWVRSDEIDPELLVEVLGSGTSREDDDSGGGTTAWTEIEVQPGDVVWIGISSAGGARGRAELHVVTSRETESTRAAGRLVVSELKAVFERQREGRFEEARAGLEQVLAQLDGIEGRTESRELGEAYLRLGDAAMELDRTVSLRAWSEVVAARSRRLPPGHRGLLTLRGSVAGLRREFGDARESVEELEAILAIWREVAPPEDTDRLKATGNLAGALATLGDFDRARALFEELHEVWSRTLAPEDPILLRAKANLAIARGETGDVSGELELLREVLTAWERSLAPDSLDLARLRVTTARSMRSNGYVYESHDLLEQVLAIQSRKLRPDDPDLSFTMQSLGFLRLDVGDYEGARELFEQIVAVEERRKGSDRSSLQAARGGLASVLAKLGDLDGARALYESVLADFRRTLPPDDPSVLRALNNVAAAHLWLREPASAKDLLEAVAGDPELTRHLNQNERWSIESNLGLALLQTGDARGALDWLEIVREGQEQSLSADHPELLSTLANLAVAEGALGNRDRALQLDRRVHSARERRLPPGHPLTLNSKQNLADSLWAAGEREAAMGLCAEIAESLASQLERALLGSPREAGFASRDALRRLSMARYPGAASDDGFERAGFEVLETARHVASAPLYSRLLRIHRDESLDARRRLLDAQASIDRIMSSGPRPAFPSTEKRPPEVDAETWVAELQSASLARDRAQRELLSMVDGAAVGRVTAPAVAERLPADHVVVAITKLERWQRDETTGQRMSDGSSYLAYVVLPDGDPRSLDLGSADDLERSIATWRQALRPGTVVTDVWTRGGLPVIAAAPVGEAAAGRALRRELLDPLLELAGEPAAGSVLHFCLDDALLTLPIDALPLEAGAEVAQRVEGDVPRVGDRYHVLYELSLARLLEPAPEAEGEPSVLAVGGVDYGEVSELRDEHWHAGEAGRMGDLASWVPLPGTAAEVDALKQLAESHLKVELEVLEGEAATEAALAPAVTGKRYVHLATHGWFVPGSAQKSLLDLERGAAPVRNLLIGETVTGFAPLALCGLVLSGANRGPGSAGLLSAQELLDLNLGACDLAVLSACDTNVGVIRAGQGVQSLQRALHMAGARSSITSLWAIPDRPTLTLMQRFYENLWGRGLGKADALWEAKRTLRIEGHAPSAWAGWVLAGEP